MVLPTQNYTDRSTSMTFSVDSLIKEIQQLPETEQNSQYCIFCGQPHADTSVIFPPTFTAYQLLQAGNHSCKLCDRMFTDAKYRRKNFTVKNEQYIEVSDALSYLQNMPQPPYILYFTKQKRKHGWINAVQNPVLNTEQFILCVDETKILFNRQEFNKLSEILSQLWSKELPKKVLLNGYPNTSTIRKYQLSRKECQMLRNLQSNRMWQFMVSFKRKENNNESE